jgi:hypothetical protein
VFRPAFLRIAVEQAAPDVLDGSQDRRGAVEQ